MADNTGRQSERGQYRVAVNIGTTVFVTVEAKDEDEAVDAAYEVLPSMCAQCSGWGQDWGRDEWEPDWDNATVEHIGGQS